MEHAVEQHRLESKTFEVKMNKVLNENKRLLEQVISKDIVNIIVNSSMDNTSAYVHECENCLKHETELLNKKDFIEKETYDKLFISFTTLEKHCISLEVDSQLNWEIFQRDNLVSNQSAPSFDHYFKFNELKSQSQEKDTVISKLKDIIKSLSGNMKEDKIKKDLEEIETINIELDHRVSKLIAENKHLKQTYKQLYDSMKSARIRSKEQCDDFINQVNLKSLEISDLNASLQEKNLVITVLKDDLRKLKGKALADDVVTSYSIALKMLNVDVEPLAPKLLNNRTVYSDYLRHTQEQAVILREVVKQGKSQNPLNNSLDHACKYTKRIQELLIIIRQTYPSINDSSGKLVAVTPMNKAKRRKVWKQTRKVFTNIRYTWRPIGRTFTIVGDVCPLTRITTTTEMPSRKPIDVETKTPKPVVTLVYSRKPRKYKSTDPVSKSKVFQIVLWYLDSGCSKHMTEDRSQLTNFVNKFLGTVTFGNDHMEKIMGYDDYHVGNVTISRVYYVEGLRHNLFFAGQFCDSNLKVAFHQHTCFIPNLDGVNLLTGSRGN
nr:integrase, catalytic region, zinc finger, CCHC-type, peptidase aspartic, catalytic [Tanacetum cinerariifolium]